ncbi:MAG: TadE family type IV pilus minor pilin [Candidatus Nanopelagicales bacterium]|nr:TadE family type IV pilus minor pilin [Candidatus Nanopelagicales bacterium]
MPHPSAQEAPRRAEHRRAASESGMVTLETALATPLIVILTLGLAWTVALGAAQARADGAARDAALLVARGATDEAAAAEARRILGPVSVEVRRSQEHVSVRVSRRFSGPGPVLSGLDYTVSADSVAVMERS